MPASRDVRKQFIDFFTAKHGHTFVASSPVVPLDDPTLLFTNAGMNQFKPYFLGTEQPKVRRVANTQKCIRAGGKHNDLDDVGKDTYHHTFFEMLGNWSFGDYFKPDAIAWAWELLTVVWGIDKSRLHVTVFEGDPDNGIPRDDEAADIWKSVGVLPGHIHLGNKKDNFWEMGDTGPCGPCTEIHFDRTADKSGAKLVNGGSPECIEIWNNVFIQFNRNADRSLTPLPAKHVDTGMGFERICAVLNNVPSNYDTDVFTPIFETIRSVSDARPYGGDLADLTDIAYRVIADHIRTLTFALTDGAKIGNDGRDYVLKRVLRRAERYGRQCLGTNGPFLHKLVPPLVALMGDTFPELNRNPEKVREQIYSEEVAFLRNLDRGMKLFLGLSDAAKAAGTNTITGEDAFKLHDTFGVFIDITRQMAEEQGLKVDDAGYEKAMTGAKDKARAGGKKHTVAAVKGELPKTDDAPKYDSGACDATVLGWVVGSDVTRAGTLPAGATVALLLDRTNFYAEQGGQTFDTGLIRSTTGAEFLVEDTQRLGDAVLHFGTVIDGELKVGDAVVAVQNTNRRIDVMRNHTATHLMNLGLKLTLGGHVEQKGSAVDDSRTRFDFSHDKPLTADEIREIERRVNTSVARDLPVTALEMPLAEAKKIDGVRAVFGEKYPDPVRVVLIGPEKPEHANFDDSVEFCGGTHVPRTGTIGYFKIVSQEPVAKGVRRVTAVTGRAAAEFLEGVNVAVDDLTARFKCKPDELPGRVEALQTELQAAKAKLEKAQAAELAAAADGLLANAVTVGASKLIVGKVPAAGADAMRMQLDRLKSKAGSALVVFLSDDDGKVGVLVGVSADLVAKGVKAGDVIKPIAEAVGGKGGGKPDVAQAGGKDAAKIPDAVRIAIENARKMLE